MARDWFALSNRWFEDEIICLIAETHPVVMALWPILCGMAKDASEEGENPEGEIGTTTKKLHSALLGYGDVEQVSGCLDLLVEGELIEVEKRPLGSLRIKLLKFSKWNGPRGGTRDRKRSSRGPFAGKKGSNVTLLSQEVTELSQSVTHTTPHHTTQTPPPKPKSRRVSGLDPDQIEAIIQTHRERLGSLAPQVDSLVALLAAGNKSNTVAASRALNKLWAPIALLVDTLSPEALAYGLSAAISNEAPNANYVEKAAKGFNPSRQPAAAPAPQWRPAFTPDDPYGEEPRID